MLWSPIISDRMIRSGFLVWYIPLSLLHCLVVCFYWFLDSLWLIRSFCWWVHRRISFILQRYICGFIFLECHFLCYMISVLPFFAVSEIHVVRCMLWSCLVLWMWSWIFYLSLVRMQQVRFRSFIFWRMKNFRSACLLSLWRSIGMLFLRSWRLGFLRDFREWCSLLPMSVSSLGSTVLELAGSRVLLWN